MQLTTWRRLAAQALLPAAAALAAAGCDPRAGDPALPSTDATAAPTATPPGTTTGTIAGSGIRVSNILTPAVPAALATPVSRTAP